MHLLMDISCKGVRSSWDFYQRKDFMYDLAKRMAPTTSGRRWDLCYQIKSIEIMCWIATPWQTVQMSCMYVCWFECYTHFHQQILVVWTKEGVKRWPGWRGGKGWIFRPSLMNSHLSTFHRTPYIINYRQAYPVRPALELCGR